jgi:hypothetical protein
MQKLCKVNGVKKKKGKDKGRILNIKYSAGNRGWHDKGQGKKVKGERLKGRG